MSLPKLENLIRIGGLRAEPFDKREFDGLVRSARNRLTDAKRTELSLESRFDLQILRWSVYERINANR